MLFSWGIDVSNWTSPYSSGKRLSSRRFKSPMNTIIAESSPKLLILSNIYSTLLQNCLATNYKVRLKTKHTLQNKYLNRSIHVSRWPNYFWINRIPNIKCIFRHLFFYSSLVYEDCSLQYQRLSSVFFSLNQLSLFITISQVFRHTSTCNCWIAWHFARLGRFHRPT